MQMIDKTLGTPKSFLEAIYNGTLQHDEEVYNVSETCMANIELHIEDYLRQLFCAGMVGSLSIEALWLMICKRNGWEK